MPSLSEKDLPLNPPSTGGELQYLLHLQANAPTLPNKSESIRFLPYWTGSKPGLGLQSENNYRIVQQVPKHVIKKKKKVKMGIFGCYTSCVTILNPAYLLASSEKGS
jgi:hypothetical protein